MARFALTKTTPLLLGMLALAACPSDDASIDTEGTTTTDGGTTTMGPMTEPTPEPDSSTSTSVGVDDTTATETSTATETTAGEPMCEPECPLGECCVGGGCFDAPAPTCGGGCGENEDCVCPEGEDPCGCEGECVPSACGIEGGYDPCFGVQCEDGYICLVDVPAAPTVSWCALEGCANACDCPLPPEGFEAACEDLIMAGSNQCSIACGAGGACPDGMFCFQSIACVWPAEVPEVPGYDPCILPLTECEAGQACLDDAMGMVPSTWEVCVEEGCVDAGDCTLTAPATGDAPVACGDPSGGGTNVCYLDCAGGQTCPDGMECIDDALCAWPQGTEVFADDFEDGNLTTPAWTLYDEDGLVPDPMVALVDAAWVATDAVEAGNFTAVATSWYVPPGISDDWMVTPQLMLGANPRISWVSRSADVNFPDALEVLVSTTGNTPADFTDPPVLIANPESVVYETHVVDLAAYANQSVYIAFRSRGDDGTLLLVDNVSVVNLP